LLFYCSTALFNNWSNIQLNRLKVHAGARIMWQHLIMRGHCASYSNTSERSESCCIHVDVNSVRSSLKPTSASAAAAIGLARQCIHASVEQHPITFILSRQKYLDIAYFIEWYIFSQYIACGFIVVMAARARRSNGTLPANNNNTDCLIVPYRNGWWPRRADYEHVFHYVTLLRVRQSATIASHSTDWYLVFVDISTVCPFE